MMVLSLLLFSSDIPKSKKEIRPAYPTTRINKKSTTSCTCGPNLTIHATLPFGRDADIFKIIVINNSTGKQTGYTAPTSDILYPQDGGFNYTITYIFNSTKTGWLLYYFNSNHTECANADFRGTHAVIKVNTLCEDYEIGPSDGWRTIC